MSMKPKPWEKKKSTPKKGGIQPDQRTPSHTSESRRTPSGHRSVTREFANGPNHANSIYSPKYADMLLDHFKIDVENGYTSDTGQVVSTSKDGAEFLEGKREGLDFPSIAGFCSRAKIGRVTYHRWANDVSDNGIPKYPEFYEANIIIQARQEDLLLSNGLKGYYNPGFAKFVLNTYHDKVEKTARDLTMKGNISVIIDGDDEEL